MQIHEWDGDYPSIAALSESSARELETRDLAWGAPVARWVARRAEQPVAVITVRERPDRRLLVALEGDVSTYEPLLCTVADRTDRHLYASVTDAQPDLRIVLAAAGFAPEIEVESFVVPFKSTIAALRHTPIPAGFTIVQVADADSDLLFDLDNAVRSRVPGMDGWQGRRSWFRSELDDPAAYLVAIDAAGRYAGLARIWCNEAGPRFGLVGTRHEYQRRRLGPALLQRVLRQAAAWGHKAFVAETAVSNRYLYTRLSKVATDSCGVRTQMVRPGLHR